MQLMLRSSFALIPVACSCMLETLCDYTYKPRSTAEWPQQSRMLGCPQPSSGPEGNIARGPIHLPLSIVTTQSVDQVVWGPADLFSNDWGGCSARHLRGGGLSQRLQRAPVSATQLRSGSSACLRTLLSLRPPAAAWCGLVIA